MSNETKKKLKKKVVVVEEVEVGENVESKKNDTKIAEVKEAEVKVLENNSETIDEIDEDRPNYLWIIIPTALLVGALVGGLITYFSGISNLDQAISTPIPTATVSPLVEKTPQSSPSLPVLKRSEIKIQVLNGSGVAGAAGKAKIFLEELGYKDVEIGNTGRSDFKTTEIAIKADKKKYLDLIIDDLSKNYEVVESLKPLSMNNKYDVVITLGKK